jgi:hypothetical protein
VGTQSEHWDGSCVTHLLSRLRVLAFVSNERGLAVCMRANHLLSYASMHASSSCRRLAASILLEDPPAYPQGRRSTTTHDTQTAQLFGVIFFLDPSEESDEKDFS